MISAVVLSHNDEDSIAATLVSLAWCDEVIVIDDYSTDASADIAKKNHALVYKRHLEGDFAAQRNFGLEKARGDWVIFVDSDEVVSEALAKEIQAVVRHSRPDRESALKADPRIKSEDDKKWPGMTGNVGYYFHRRDHMWGRALKYGETANVRLLRLAKKDAGKWKGNVHEIWDIRGITGELSEPLEHFPHPNVAQFLKEINTYSSLRAQQLHKDHIHVSWWHVVLYPTAKFFVNYFWRLGFLDGTNGAVSALMMSFHSFLVRGKLWELGNNHEV